MGYVFDVSVKKPGGASTFDLVLDSHKRTGLGGDFSRSIGLTILAAMQKSKLFVTVAVVAMVTCGLMYRSSPSVGVSSFGVSTVGRLFEQSGDEEMTRMAAIHVERRNHVIRQCKARAEHYYAQKIHEGTGRLIHEKKHELVYCYIPKNGCSFWKRVVSILGGAHNGSSVFNLSSTAIHGQTGRSFDVLEGKSFLQKYHYLQSSNKFMFARDPYERLFSGYIDKVFAPCAMPGLEEIIAKLPHDSTPEDSGNSRGPTGLEMTRRTVSEKKMYRRRRREAGLEKQRTVPSEEEAEDSCEISSFSGFLEYVTNTKGVNVDGHFSKQYDKCFPCLIDYDFIGKMETFRDDANFILQSAGIDPAVVFGPEEKFEENSDVNIIKDVARRSFTRCRGAMSGYCQMRRIWVTFQVRGFLSADIEFPLSKEEADSTTLQRFQELAISAYRQSRDRSVVKGQRHLALLEAYYTVPRPLLAKLERYVSDDCELFGYNCSIASRFHPSAKPSPVFHLDSFWK